MPAEKSETETVDEVSAELVTLEQLIERARDRQRSYLTKAASLTPQIFTTSAQWERVIFEFAQRKSLHRSLFSLLAIRN